MAERDWMPGCVRRPGFNSGYTNGACYMVNCKLHWTGGVNSVYRGDEGYFQFLVPKEGPPWQFAEANALCWDSGDWNRDGPGIEFERLGGAVPHTDNQIRWGGLIIHWLNGVYGIPVQLYNREDRIPRWSGFIAHRSLASRGTAADHTDFVSGEDWLRMIQSEQPRKDDVPVFYCYNPHDSSHTEIWCVTGNTRRHIGPDEWLFAQYVGVQAVTISADWFDTYPVASG